MAEAWHENPHLWEALDDLMRVTNRPLKELLDILYEYESTLHPLAKTVLYGGLATFVSNYGKLRNNTNPPNVSFAEAMKAVQNNPLMVQMFAQGIENTIDEKEEGMKNE